MFSRSWRLYQLLFPGTGSETGRPNDVSQTVMPSWDVFRLQLGESYLRTERIATTNGGAPADITHQFSSANHVGRIQIPVSLVGYDAAAATGVLRVDCFLSEPGPPVPVDSWGRFGLGTNVDVEYGGTVMPAQGVKTLPMPLLIPQGNWLTVVYRAAPAAVTITTDFMYFDIPGEVFQYVPTVNQGGPS